MDISCNVDVISVRVLGNIFIEEKKVYLRDKENFFKTFLNMVQERVIRFFARQGSSIFWAKNNIKILSLFYSKVNKRHLFYMLFLSQQYEYLFDGSEYEFEDENMIGNENEQLEDEAESVPESYDNKFLEGNRFINSLTVFNELENFRHKDPECSGIKDVKLDHETFEGLCTFLHFKCERCGVQRRFRGTDKRLDEVAVQACLSTGIHCKAIQK